MADLIGEAARRHGIEVDVKLVEETKPEDLLEYDGIVVGSPTYFSNISWQVKRLIDESIVLYRDGHQLEGKVGGCFTSSGTHKDAEDCIRMIEIALGVHHRMSMVPGIIGASWLKDEQLAEICRKYGEEIARKLTALIK